MTPPRWRSCVDCRYRDNTPDLACAHAQVMASYQWKEPVPVLIERRNSAGQCGERGELWTMFTEGNS